MMENARRSAEATGRSVDEAIERALEDLGAERGQVETQVLSEGSRGLFGLGAEDARVRVTLVESPSSPEVQIAEEPWPASGEVADISIDVVRSLLQHMGVDATVAIREAPEDTEMPTVLDVEGEDLGILIGRQGETLRDVQYITRLIVSRKLQRWVNVLVDVGGYKRRRERVLRELAERMADRATDEGRPVTLEPMPAYERRTVHMALRDHEFVTTESTGEGRHRKVVILPKRGA